jgi:hypothetical protein
MAMILVLLIILGGCTIVDDFGVFPGMRDPIAAPITSRMSVIMIINGVWAAGVGPFSTLKNSKPSIPVIKPAAPPAIVPCSLFMSYPSFHFLINDKIAMYYYSDDFCFTHEFCHHHESDC